MKMASEERFRQLGKKLMGEAAVIIAAEDGSFNLVKRGRRGDKGLAILDAEVFSDWRRADFIAAETKGPNTAYVLTASGRAHLRRHAGGDFAAQHAMDTPARAQGDEPRKLATTPLQWLKARGQSAKFGLNDMELEAGGRLHDDFYRALQTPHQTMDWSRPVFVDGSRNDSDGDIPAAIMDAQNRLAKALAYIGPGLADMALEICCSENGLEAIEKKFSLPRRSAKLMLKLALMRLSVHYGYQSASAAAASFRMR